MNNIDLIDDYLTGRLSDTQREAFEQQLNADPSLKADVEFQQQVIDGLKKARVAELKSMLSKVPVPAVKEFTTLKVAAGIVGGALLVGALYWYNDQPDQPIIAEPEDTIQVITETEQNSPVGEEFIPIETNKKEEQVFVNPELKKQSASASAVKPFLQVVDPSQELVESTSSPVNHGEVRSSAPAIELTSIQVDIDTASKKYKFHYQYTQNKVVLYGSFDRSLYEIIELNGENHSVYLFYQNKYYHLQETATDITPLEPLTDKAALMRLEAYRKK
ncbi:MAG: hypothetical protein KF763_01425 [Cyclobacteriaceae bacterium]|nr:hypothetical protein [Cyclobacteriaceae bacterium]